MEAPINWKFLRQFQANEFFFAKIFVNELLILANHVDFN